MLLLQRAVYILLFQIFRPASFRLYSFLLSTCRGLYRETRRDFITLDNRALIFLPYEISRAWYSHDRGYTIEPNWNRTCKDDICQITISQICRDYNERPGEGYAAPVFLLYAFRLRVPPVSGSYVTLSPPSDNTCDEVFFIADPYALLFRSVRFLRHLSADSGAKTLLRPNRRSARRATVHDCRFVFRDYAEENLRFMTTRAIAADSQSCGPSGRLTLVSPSPPPSLLMVLSVRGC